MAKKTAFVMGGRNAEGQKYVGLLKVLEDTEIQKARIGEVERLLLSEDGGDSWHRDHDVSQKVALVKKRAWELSFLPAKSLFMNVVMIWMMGGGGVFAFIILAYAVLSAVRVLLGVSKSFDDLQGSVAVPVNTLLQRTVYIIFASAFLGYFLLQCSKSGLLPVTEVRVGTLPSIVSNKLEDIVYSL
eukprot:Gregarina_sp_Poly_1__2385@NODE_163_length_12241_cov_147_232955_g145_i0_p7_GENE_NODE_163_length_12241_cov_147_232955_g145_i0NODE_163_length_12241_cov_147_232955_g145_i0_p7_ORF_typecomplete_len186_score25_83DUF1077/PF06417_12/4_3e23TRP/PF06011_12/0_05_NODE_163_length_12241_cov_147_232955_g145_i037164273